jgi:hypothetical protein
MQSCRTIAGDRRQRSTGQRSFRSVSASGNPSHPQHRRPISLAQRLERSGQRRQVRRKLRRRFLICPIPIEF